MTIWSRRGAGIAASAILMAAVLSACAAGSPTGTSGDPALTISPTAPSAQDGVPTGDDLVDWAATVLPEDQIGGATYEKRDVASLKGKTDAVVIDVSQPDGEWAASVACINIGGTPMTFQVVQDGAFSATGQIPCAKVGGDPAAVTSIPFDGGVTAELQFTADEATGLLYEVATTENLAD